MPSKKKKKFHYVIVFTPSGAKYVTELGEHHTCKWVETDKPLELGESFATDMTIGLCLNGYTAAHVVYMWEIDAQPYNYDKYDCKFEAKENTNNTEN